MAPTLTSHAIRCVCCVLVFVSFPKIPSCFKFPILEKMYKHEYQGGPSVEILSCQGKDPLSKWKVSGGSGAAQRVYDKDIKGFICHLEGSTATSKLQLPKDATKQSLFLTQRYLTLQLFIPSGKDFSIELSMSDTTNSRRRLLMSTSIREMSVTPLHAKLNLSIVKRNTWLNLCFDLASLLSDIFLKQTFKCLDVIVVSGNCKVRKIFTMRNQPPDTTDCELVSGSSSNGTEGSSDRFFQLENVPASLQFASTVVYSTQVINVKKIRNQLRQNSKGDLREMSAFSSISSEDYLQGKQNPKISARDTPQPPSRIAFGTRVRLDSTGSLVSSEKSSSRSMKDSIQEQRVLTSNILTGYGDTKNSNNSSNHSWINDKAASLRSGSYKPLRRNPKLVVATTIPAVSSSKTNTGPSDQPLTHLPTSLATFMDELEMVGNENDVGPGQRTNSHDKIFSFSSRPHIAHRGIEVSNSPEFASDANFDEDFFKSDGSDSDSGSVEHILVNATNVSKSRSPINSPILAKARTTDQSLRAKPVYNSTKYSYKPGPSDKAQTDVPVQNGFSSPTKRILEQSISSLRDSDATLISSVDTLGHNSTNKENEIYPEDSLEEPAAAREYGSDGNTSHHNVTISRKTLREIPPSATFPINAEESLRVEPWSESFEAKMLSSIKREQEEEMMRLEEQQAIEHQKSMTSGAAVFNGDTSCEDHGEESFDASWSTWKQPPGMDSEAYAHEMKGSIPAIGNMDTLAISLNRSNPRDWENLPSPPIVLPSERAKQEKDIGSLSEAFGMSDGSTVSGHSTSVQESDDEEMLDLMYDPCLNCYFDPKSGRYYELKG